MTGPERLDLPGPEFSLVEPLNAHWLAGFSEGAHAVARAVLYGRQEMFDTVRADLERLKVTGANAATLKATALSLARTLDAYTAAGTDTAAALTAQVKAMSELRIIFARLADMDTSARDSAAADARAQSTPQWTP